MALNYNDLWLDPVAIQIGSFALMWYSLSYLAGFVLGYIYLLKLLDTPGAPMARRHADDLIGYIAAGVMIGGRFGYILFYQPQYYLADPLAIFRVWEGGMSFHGGVIGTSIAIIIYTRRHGLDWLKVHDYVACTVPIGLGLGRLANFNNGELWGATTTLPWGIVFPTGGPLPRHPTQLYEAFLEGMVLFLILGWAFYKTNTRYEPGKLVGYFLAGYGISRFLIEYLRESDAQLLQFAEATGLHMGQWLSLPMIAGGGYLIATARARQKSNIILHRN